MPPRHMPPRLCPQGGPAPVPCRPRSLGHDAGPHVVTGQANPPPSKSESEPRHKVLVTCFNGKIDSGSLCSTGLYQADGTLHKAGKMTCGYPGKTSEIEYAFVGRRGDKDIYAFTRRFPLGTPAMTTAKREVEFSGDRIKVFEDESQCIVIESGR